MIATPANTILASSGDAQEPVYQDCHLPKELFVIPDGDLFLLYSPWKKGLALVNAGTLRALQIWKKTGDLHLPPAQIQHLFDTGVLVTDSDREGAIRFDPRTGQFDPIGVALFLTTKCSMACSYCYAEGGSKAKTMSWQTAKAAIDWMMDHTVRMHRNSLYLVFHGGGDVGTARTLLQRCVHHAREEAAKRGLAMRIDAGLNGMLDLPMVDWILEHLDGATVSLDGGPAIHNAQRPLVNGQESFGHVAATLRRMDERKFQYGIRMTVTAASLPYLADSADFIAANFAATVIHAEPVFAAGRARLAQGVDSQEFVARFRQARERVKKHGKDLRYSGARFDQLHNQFCKVSNDSFVVTTNGSITSCFEVGEQDDPRADLFIYGRMDADNVLPELDNEKVQRLRTLTVENKPHCASCFCKWHCAGDCAAKLAYDGDAWNPARSPRCHINRELTKDLMKEYLGALPGRVPPSLPDGASHGSFQRTLSTDVVFFPTAPA